MYYSDEFNIDDSFEQPANAISELHPQEVNQSSASFSHDPFYTYHYMGPSTHLNPIPSLETLAGGADIYQPGSLTNLDHQYPELNVTNEDLQAIIDELNADVDSKNFGDSNVQEHSEHETEQCNTQINTTQVLGDVTNSFENSSEQVHMNINHEHGNETGQINAEIDKPQVLGDASNNSGNLSEKVAIGEETSEFEVHGSVILSVVNNSVDSNVQVQIGDENCQSKMSEESETLVEDLEIKKVTKTKTKTKTRTKTKAKTLTSEEYMNHTQHLDYDISNVTWLQRPADLLTEPPLWSLLWRYGVKYFESINEPRTQDYTNYIEKIRLLINTAKGKKQADNTRLSKDYQMVSSDGRVWREKDIVNEAKVNIDVDVETKKIACVSPSCENCVFKKHKAIRSGKLYEHIYELLGVRYRCLYCGLFSESKDRILNHLGGKMKKGAKKCSAEWAECSDVRGLKATTNPYEISACNLNFGDRFLEWTRLLIKNIKKDNYLTSQSMEILIEQVKSEIDFNFVDFFQALEKIDPENIKRFSVDMRSDDFYSVIYWTENTVNTDPNKSAMFKIVERHKRTPITIQDLETLAGQTSNKFNVCSYERCWCEGEFKASDYKTLLHHVLTSNIIIVCVACGIGFDDFIYFERHLVKSDCFLTRNQDKQLPYVQIVDESELAS